MESPGIEPGSKQATKELSTRLFPDWIFDVELGQKQPPNTYLLKFRNPPEAHGNLGLFLRFPLTERHKPRLSRRIQLPYLVETWRNLTMIRIMQLKRNYFRRVKVRDLIFTSKVSMLDVLTVQFDLLSKPVDPKK